MSAARDFADKTWIVFTSRLSMILTAPVAGLLVFFGSQWLDQRFDAQAAAITSVVERVKALETDNLPTRLSILENTIVQRGAARDQQLETMSKVQAAQGDKIDKLIDSIALLQSQVAALNATVRSRMP